MTSQYKRLQPVDPWKLVCLFLIAGPNSLCGEEHASMIDSPSPQALKDRTDWFGSYFQDHKCGWARITRKKVEKENGEYFVVELESLQKIASMGKAYDDHTLEYQEFSAEPPYSFVGGEFQSKQSARTLRIQLERRGDDFLAEIDDGAEQREMIISDVEFCLLDHLAVEDWIRGRPAVGERLNVRRFSFRDLKNSIETYQVVFSGEENIQGKNQRVWETSWGSSTYGNIGRITFDHEGRALLIRQGDTFEMRLEDEQEAKKIESRADFFSRGTVGIDRALGAPPAQISSMVLDVTGEEASGLLSGPGISVERTARSDSCRVTTGFGRTAKIEATAEEIAGNLKETLVYPIHDAEIQALARQSAGDASSDEEKVREMIDFVDRLLGEDASQQVMTVKETIREQKGDCSERAALLVTLSRANGIPAREVHGLMYTSDLFKCFAGHSWCEVVLDGFWVPVDPTWRQIPVDGTHIRFDPGEKGLAQLMKMMGGLTFDLVEVELGETPASGEPAREETGTPKKPQQ